MRPPEAREDRNTLRGVSSWAWLVAWPCGTSLDRPRQRAKGVHFPPLTGQSCPVGDTGRWCNLARLGAGQPAFPGQQVLQPAPWEPLPQPAVSRVCVLRPRSFPTGQRLGAPGWRSAGSDTGVVGLSSSHHGGPSPLCLREDTAQLHLPDRPPSWPAPTGSPCLRTGLWAQRGACPVGVRRWGCRDSAGTPPMAPETHRTGLPHVTWGRCLKDQV